jgi:tetratricopeptide (TPR) repeat protein
LKAKEYAEAVSMCKKALDIEPNNVKALYRRAQGYHEGGDFDEARADYRRVAELCAVPGALLNIIANDDKDKTESSTGSSGVTTVKASPSSDDIANDTKADPSSPSNASNENDSKETKTDTAAVPSSPTATSTAAAALTPMDRDRIEREKMIKVVERHLARLTIQRTALIEVQLHSFQLFMF